MPPGQPEQNGHARARRGGGERLKACWAHTDLTRDRIGLHTWYPILTLDSHAGPLTVGTLLQGQSSGGPAGDQPVAFTITLVQTTWPGPAATPRLWPTAIPSNSNSSPMEPPSSSSPRCSPARRHPRSLADSCLNSVPRTRPSVRHSRSTSKRALADDANGGIQAASGSVPSRPSRAQSIARVTGRGDPSRLGRA
jgi:hypothetical protein